MIEPMMEFHNGTKRPVMFVVSTPFSGVPVETLIEPGGHVVAFDQRVKTTAMVRDLTEAEMDVYIEEKLEREKEDGKRKA
jgi:hypothetical protein